MTVKSPDGVIDTVRATANHPWLMASHQCEGTNALHANDRVESATGDDLTVISVRATGKIEPVYNFTVADTHTYLVGKSHAVVHNICLKGVFAKYTTDAPALQKLIGWGTKEAGAIERTASITPNEVAKMRADGLTHELAQDLRDAYAGLSAGKGGAVAPLRVNLMDKILANW